ncbi:MAG: NADP oxidoreductase [Chloroflexi bacterium]|nr:NADP oxidoreductase [Chloroflexota bacterium]
MSKATFATVWLDGCSGCHMSFLDIDEFLLDLADKIELVYSPLVDNKDFPEMVEVTLVEGAVSNADDYEKIQYIRQHTRTLISLGDCAVTGNVPSMRNPFFVDEVIDRAYNENVTINPQVPHIGVPELRPWVVPVHTIVPVDVYVPGCPPSAALIKHVLTELLEGRKPDLSDIARFG